jgi:hypothetical protein
MLTSMAYKLVFPAPQNGMPFIWNVSAHVGWGVEHPNRPTDVELVQFLLSELTKKGVVGRTANGAAKSPPIQVNGRFDPVIGFWIWFAQDSPSLKTETIDGIVSPAKGMSYGGGKWLIAKLNFSYKQHFPNDWQNLNSDTRLSSALRADLSKTTP